MVQAKGVGVAAVANWVRTEMPQDKQKGVFDRLRPETVALLEDIVPTRWYDGTQMGEFFDAIAMEACAAAGPERERCMRAVGKRVAEDNLKAVYALALKVAGTPNLLLRFMPRMWSTYWDTAEATFEEHRDGSNGGIFKVRGIDGVAHLSPVGAGWKEYGLAIVGAKNVVITEETYAKGAVTSGEFIYSVTWS